MSENLNNTMMSTKETGPASDEEVLKSLEETEDYEYDGTNAQYLFPTEEDSLEFSSEENTLGFNSYTGDPYAGSSLEKVRKKNVEWAIGKPLLADHLSSDEYAAYLDAFNKMGMEKRTEDATKLTMDLIESGVSPADVHRLMQDIRDLPPLTGEKGLFKEGHTRDLATLFAEDPEAAKNVLEGRANVASANYRILMQKASEAPYTESNPDGFLDYLQNEFGTLATSAVAGLEGLPFVDKMRVAQMNKDMRGLLNKYGADGTIFEGLRVDPTSFYEDMGKFFISAMVNMPTTEFKDMVEEFDAILKGWSYSDVARFDFWNQVTEVEEFVNKLSWGTDIVSLVPLAGIVSSGAKSLAKAGRIVKKAKEQQRAAKAAGHTVEGLANDIEKAKASLDKAKTPKQKEKAEKALQKLEDLQKVVRGDEVEAAETLVRLEKNLLKSAALGATADVFPAAVLAARGVYLGVTSPLQSLKAIGNFTGAAKLFSKGLITNSTPLFRNTEEHSKAVFNALEAVNGGYGAQVIKGETPVAGSPLVDKSIEVSKRVASSSAETQKTMTKVLGEITEKGHLSSITEKSLDAPKKRTAAEIKEALGRSRRVRPLLVNIEDRSTGTAFVTRLSSPYGKGWSRATANKIVEDLKRNAPIDVAEEYRVFQDSTGFHVDVERRYARTEGGYKFTNDFIYENLRKNFKGKEKTLPGTGGLFGPFVDHIASVGQTVTTFQRTLGNILQHDQGVVFEVLSAIRNKIDKGNKRVLDHLIRRTRSESKWFDSEWLKTVGVDQKTVDAYEAYIVLSDLSAMLHKRNLVNNLIRTGKKDLSVVVDGIDKPVRVGIGKPLSHTDVEGKEVFIVRDYNYVDDVYVGEATTEALDPTAYNFYHVLYGRNTSNNIIAIPVNATVEKQITSASVETSYIPGRMVFSPDSGFIKQAITNSDGSLKDIRTLFAHPDLIAVNKVAKVMEEARQIAIKYDNGAISAEAAMAAFEKIADRSKIGYADFTSFYRACTGEDAIFSLKPGDKIQAVKDGEMLEGFADKAQEFFNFKGASFLGYSNTEQIVSKRLRKNEEIFNPFTLEDAPRTTPTEEIAITTHNIVSLSTKAEYTRLLAEDMVRIFKGRNGCDTTEEARNILLYGAPNKAEISDDTKARFNHMSTVYKTLFGMPTQLDRAAETFFQKLAHYVVPDYAGKGGLRTSIYYGMRNWSPVKQMQALAFHWYLGLLNPRQFYKQAASILSTTALSPIAGGKALGLGIPFMMYTMTENKAMLKNLSKFTGYTAEEIEDLSKIVKRLDISSRGSYSGALEATEDTRSRWKLNSTFFYDAGERINRYFSALVTAIEKGKKYKDITESEWAAMLTRQNNLYFNMGRAGMSPIQTGYGRIVTQFQGWTMRWWETMFDRQIDTSSKISLAIYSGVLGGTNAIFGRGAGSVIYNLLERAGVEEDTNLAIAMGAGDILVKKAGGDVSVGEFADASIIDIFADIGNIPSVSAAQSAYEVSKAPVLAVYDFFKNPDNEDFTFYDALSAQARKLQIEGKLPSGINKAVVAWTMFHTGLKYKANGLIDREGVTLLESLAYGMGFRSIDDAEEFLLRNAITDKEQFAKDVAETTMTYITLSKQHPYDSDYYLQMAKATLDNIRKMEGVDIEGLVDEELSKGFRRLNTSDVEYLAKRILQVYEGKTASKKEKTLLNITEEN